MITAGIDVGARTIKVVLVDDAKMLSYRVVASGLDPAASAKEALDEMIKEAGISQSEVKRIISTGIGRKGIPFADDSSTEIVCDAMGARHLLPSTRTVIDIGAEESRSIKCDVQGKVIDFAKNDKCAAGVGAFVEAMARALETTVEEMGEMTQTPDQEIQINVTCVIFAESEVVSLIHNQTPKPDIVWAIHDAIASRTVSMARRVGVEEEIVLIGGMARDRGVVECMKRHLGTGLLVPENPEIVGALGAALLAAN